MRLAPAAAIALVLAGCGGEDASPKAAETSSQPSSTTSPPKAPEPTTTTAPEPSQQDPVESIRVRLEKGGYDPQDEELGSDKPHPEGALTVPIGGGGQVTIYVYRTYTDAARSEVSFIPVEKENPDQIEVTSEGKDVYVGTIEEPAKLAIPKFRKVIATAEGK